MQIKDAYGNLLSTTHSKASDFYDSGVALVLGGNLGATEAFASACKVDPSFCLGHTGSARALMMEGRLPEARAALKRASALADHASLRERAHVAAYSTFLDGATDTCRNLVKAHAREFPRDPMMVQLLTNVFGLIGFSGKVGREADLLAFTTSLMPHYADDWWMMSMHATSLCETGHLDKAMSLLDCSLKLNPQNAHAAHFRAHAHYEFGETATGRRFLDNWMETHDSRGVLQGHLTWHSALWALHDGDEAAMWHAVDSGIWPESSSSLPLNVLTDSASILFRAELAGVTVPNERWKSLSEYSAKFFPETGQSFVDIHAALCHAMAGEGDKLARITERAEGFAGDLVRPISIAWGAIARKKWRIAHECLTGVMASSERLGGSRAQRDLIELTYANVLIKLGKTDEARRTLQIRRPILNQTQFVANSDPVNDRTSSAAKFGQCLMDV